MVLQLAMFKTSMYFTLYVEIVLKVDLLFIFHAQDAVLAKSADNNAANDHPAAGGRNLGTRDGAHVDSADSDDDAADKEDNALATTVQPTHGARYWRAPGTITRIRPGAAHCAAMRIRSSAALGHTATIRMGVVHNNTALGSAGEDAAG